MLHSAKFGTHDTTLNEGREINPGDTHFARLGAMCQLVRSTKAGRLTPATQGSIIDAIYDQLRSTKAGRLTPATPAGTRDTNEKLKAAQRRPGD